MSNQNFTTSIVFDRSPAEAFEAICNVHLWWTENLKGNSHKLHDEFEVQFGDVHYSKQKLTEVIPGKKISWLVTDSKLNFVSNKSEWTNTKITFDISAKSNQTEVVFTHVGLAPNVECYDACRVAWTDYIHGSLLPLITKGKGKPEPKEELIGRRR